MEKAPPGTPYDFLLLLTCLLQDEDLKSLRTWTPFFHEAQWASGRLLCSQSDGGDDEDLDTLVTELTRCLAERGITDPNRVLVLLITDWEVMEAAVIERVMNRLVQWYPGAHVEALWPMAMYGRALDLILVAGKA